MFKKIRSTPSFLPQSASGNGQREDFFTKSLLKADAYWDAGRPAQAVLWLNKALSAEWPPETSRETLALPYEALIWILKRAGDGQAGFLGNPVRHFQHLASRMSGPRKEVRSWRAWYCFHLSRRVLPPAGFGMDGRQLVREGLWVPGVGRAMNEIHHRGWPGEGAAVEELWRWEGG